MSSKESLLSASPYEEKFGFCRALKVGRVIHVAGTAPIGEDGATVGVGDPAAQARRCFQIIERSLTHFGASLQDVVRTRMFLTQIADWPEIGSVHGEFFRKVQPVSTLVEVSALIDPDWRVEIEAEALIQKP